MFYKMAKDDDKRKVRFTNEKAHEDQPEFYPEVGTVGFIVWREPCEDEEDWYVMWPKDSVCGKFGVEEDEERAEGYVGRFCGEESIEFVEEDSVEIVSAIEEKEKIWKEVAPELEKNLS